MAMSSLLFLCVVLQAAGGATTLAPRQPLPKEPPAALPLPIQDASRWALAPQQPGWRLALKFRDGLRVRADGAGGIFSRAGAPLTRVRALGAELGVRFEPAIALPEAVLAQLQERAQARTGVESADLAGILYAMGLPQDARRLEEAVRQFQQIEEIEYASIETLGAAPPSDIPPLTPSFVGFQSYRLTNPGLGFELALASGATGTGVKLSDCEYNWTLSHEDLAGGDIALEPGQTPDPITVQLGFDDHGTACVGETTALMNNYGCSGAAGSSPVQLYSELTIQGGFRRLTAVTNAVAQSAAGDVVQLEMQAPGPGGSYGPAELDPNLWLIVKTGTDAGVVVVAAAGNGAQNLDSAPYAGYAAKGDSGAIIVGAGSANLQHERLGFSSYGSRVNVQAWGESVFTLGYGTYAALAPGKDQSYTASFSGTSSATPLVSAACLLVQQKAKQQLGAPLAPTILRQLLVHTGVPQGGTTPGNIGPIPNVPAAIAAIPDCLQIFSQPASATVCAGKPASLTLNATPGATMQWRKNGVEIPGATFPSLSFAMAGVSDAGSYDCVVTYPPYVLTSKKATLTIQTLSSSIGFGSAGCLGTHTLSLATCAFPGNPAFSVLCNNAPPNSLGLIFVGDVGNPTGSDAFGVGILIHVNPALSTEFLTFDMPSDGLGAGVTTVALPNHPQLAGKSFVAQALWHWSGPCAPSAFGLSSSRGLTFTVSD
ncbi:MAG: S8 family serine peptidase [Planctomycetes bacterium]|nr:S8 family serine peptidase [Planctomycetota bacterium]